MTLAFDTETRGLDWFRPEHRAFLISWADEAGSDVCTVDDAEGVARFRAAVARHDTLVAHNLPFDVHHVREAIGLDLLTSGHRLLDTDILARVAVPERRTGEGDNNGFRLKGLSKTYLRSDAQDAEEAIMELAEAAGIKLKSDGGYYDTWRAYPHEMEHYAKVDTELTRDLLPVLLNKLPDRARDVWNLERTVQPYIIRAEQTGVRVSQDAIVPLKQQYEDQAEATGAFVRAELGDEALEGSHALLEALLKHGVPLHRTTPTGDISTNKYALAEFEDRFPVLKALGEWRTATKFLATYIGPMIDRDTVHPTFWQVGAWTGRMSCSRPNMQNIPARAGSEVREMFVPRDDHSFVVCDFDSIEVRILAYYLNDERYRQMIEEGLDPHAWMSTKIAAAGIEPWAAIGYELEDFIKGSKGEKARTDAKNVLFAIVYGAGAPRVADMLGIDKQQAKELIAAIKAALPGYLALAGYRGRIRRKVETTGFVTTLKGRKQPVNKDKSYVGLNALIQGSAADIMKLAVTAVAEATDTFGAYPVLFVHDEIVVETPTEEASRVLLVTKAAMEAAHTLTPSLKVTGCIAHNNYAEAK